MSFIAEKETKRDRCYTDYCMHVGGARTAVASQHLRISVSNIYQCFKLTASRLCLQIRND